MNSLPIGVRGIGLGGGMVKVLWAAGVEGVDPSLFILSSKFLFDGGSIGGRTIGGLPPASAVLIDGLGFSSFCSTGSLASDVFLFFPNFPKKLLAILPGVAGVSMFAGTDRVLAGRLGTGADLVLEGRLGACCFERKNMLDYYRK